MPEQRGTRSNLMADSQETEGSWGQQWMDYAATRSTNALLERILRAALAPKPDTGKAGDEPDILERARLIKMTPEQREEQRRSFAYGNAAIDNPNVTREMVDEAADITKCPLCGGPADQGFSHDVPPLPYECSKCAPETHAEGADQ